MNTEFYLVPVDIIDRLRATESSFQRGVIVDELLKLELLISGGVDYDHSGTTEDRGIIDWSKTPPGTTHCFSHKSKEQTNPPEDELYFWEKWEEGDIYEWHSDPGHWDEFADVSELDDDDRANRVKRP